MSLRIGVDARAALRPSSGIGVIARNVARRIAGMAADAECFLYFDRDPQGFADECAPALCRHGGPRNKMLWPNVYAIPQMRRDRLDVFVSFHEKEIPLLPCAASVVSMTHDLIPLRFPDVVFRSKMHEAYYRLTLGWALRRSRIVMTNSEHSRGEILSVFGTPSDKVRRIALGVEPAPFLRDEEVAQALARYGLTRPYILALGSAEPRKNNLRVIEAFHRICGEFPGLSLAIGGGKWRGMGFDAEQLGERARAIGFVRDEDLPAVMSAASLFVFPSLHEGFGLPVIEAMRMGAPVVTSNVTALPEVGGDAAMYVDPLSVDEIAQAMRATLGDPTRAAAMRERGLRQAQRFTWEQCCRDVLQICREVAGSRRS